MRMLLTKRRIVLVCALCVGAGVPGARGQTPTGSAPSVNPSSATLAAKSSLDSPDPAAALSILEAEKFYRAGELDKAERAYNSLISSGSQSVLAYAGLADVYLKQKRVSDAFDAAMRAFTSAPTYPASRVALAEVYFRQGKITEAEREFVGLINSGTGTARAYLGEARISRALSFYKQSKILIDKARELDPADPDIEEFWSSTLASSGHIKVLHVSASGQAAGDDKDQREPDERLKRAATEEERSAHSCRLASSVSSMQTDLKMLLYDPKHLRGYGLDVKLNGTGATLLLDTGSGGITVDRKFAEKAGVAKIAETKMRGVGDGGEVGGYVGHVDSVKIGNIEFRDCYVSVIERKTSLDESGLIGADVFSHFLVDIDFPDGKLKLSELPRRPDDLATGTSSEAPPIELHDRYIAPEMKSYSSVFRFSHMLLVPTMVGKSKPKLFLLDTGAFNNQMSPIAAREVTKVSGDSDTTVKGLSGKVNDVFRGNDVTLSFGHLRQENQDIVAFDMTSISDSAGTEVSGMLGFAMLRLLDVKIDYRDGLVDLTYDAKRWRTNLTDQRF
jgi:tetratricopeptide (TPR) repeat protein